LSAKWRRSRKCSKWFNILRDFNRAKDKKTPNIFRTKNSKIKRPAYLYRYKAPKVHGERKWRALKPLIDVLEENGETIIVADFAGFKRENLRIRVKNQRITLSAETSDRKYYKSLNLPKRVIPNTMCTTYKNGVLTIRLKKCVEEKPIDKLAG